MAAAQAQAPATAQPQTPPPAGQEPQAPPAAQAPQTPPAAAQEPPVPKYYSPSVLIVLAGIGLFAALAGYGMYYLYKETYPSIDDMQRLIHNAQLTDKGRYGVLASFMGEHLDRKLIEANWDDVQRVITAFRNRVVAPSLILRKLGTTPRQSALSLAMREIGRIERTVHNLDWIEDKGLRADTTDVLNKGEARHTLSRAVAFHQLGRFRDRSHERQSHRAAALNLVTACIGLFNCRYLDRAVTDQRRRGTFIDDQRLRRLSPLGWDHINLTGDYVWSETATYDADGLRPLNTEPEPIAA